MFMKKKIITILLSILLVVIGLLVLISYKNKKLYTYIEGIQYAILVDGVLSNSFPSGNYKVNINCTNADAYWNSITSKVIIKNIKGNVTCDVDFSSITGNDYLNTYILGLSGITQGDGGFVHEIGELPDYTNSTVMKAFGTTPVYFRNTASTSITQTEVNSFWTFNNSTGVFTSNPTTFTASGTNNYYHAYMMVPSAGYYQICYTISQAPNYNNYLYIITNTTTLTSITAPTSSSKEGCIGIEYFEANDYINIAEMGYDRTSSPVITFRMEKANSTVSVDTGYRYEGYNPNNYVMFNNELWRIIGVFETEYDSNNDGTIDATDNLVKIIRENSIGGIAWNKTGNNDWPNSSLYHLLNEQYYDWENNKGTVSTYCYGNSTTIPTKCDYSVKGIQDGYRGMITRSKWYLGGGGATGYTSYIPCSVYSYERNPNSVYSAGNIIRPASTTGYIGLMYASDYLYGVLSSDCARTTVQGSYNSASCSGKDWLYGTGYEWTISQRSNLQNSGWSLDSNGYVNSSNVSTGSGVRPVLYLSPDVYRVSGTGTITDPYIIGMATS